MMEHTVETAKRYDQEFGRQSRARHTESGGLVRHPLLQLQRDVGNFAARDLLKATDATNRTTSGARDDLSSIALGGVTGSSRPLPFGSTIQRAFGPVHDVSNIRAHDHAPARDACSALSAEAFTYGDDIAFRGAPDIRLASHEAAHVIQQRTGVHLAGCISRENDAYEQHANRVAERVAAGNSAQDLLPTPSKSNQRPAIQRQEDGGAPPSDAGAGGSGAEPSNQVSVNVPPVGAAQQVIAALNEVDSVAGVGNFSKAFEILSGLPTPALLSTLDELGRAGELELLQANLGSAANADRARLTALVSVVRLAHGADADVPLAEALNLAHSVMALPPDAKEEILHYLLKLHGAGRSEESLIALVSAKPRTNETVTIPPGPMSPANQPISSTVPPLAAASIGARGGGLTGGPSPATGGAGGGPPPTRPQPPQLALGNLAHRLIASFYREEHPGEAVFTNFISMKRLVQEVGAINNVDYDTDLLGDESLKRPDITNLTRLHLYEIKPEALAALAAAEAAYYIALFARLGIVILPGPPGERGTVGALPLGRALLVFESPTAGVIAYGLRVEEDQRQANAQSLTTAQTVGLAILAVGIVAAAVLLTIAFPPAIVLDEALAEGLLLAESGELAAEEQLVEAGLEVGAEANEAAEAVELGEEFDLSGEAANDNAELLQQASGF